MARGYTYDPIGNRTQHTEGSPTPVTTMYTRNNLNQYTHVYRAGAPDAALFPNYDDDGNLAAFEVAGDLNCDGAINSFDIDPFSLALTDPPGYAAAYPGCLAELGDCNGDGLVNSFDINAFLALLSGGPMTERRVFEWDAENRLTAVYPSSPQAGDQKVTFKYDYLNRRVEKKVFDWTGSAWSTTPSLVRRFVYAGHLLLLELDGGNNIVRKYTWGLDLAGQAGGRGSAEPGAGLPEALEAAGGILDNAAQCQGQVGGLLAVYDLNDTPGAGQTGDDLQYVYTYDGNGNVVQVLDWSAVSAFASMKARYHYDPYGAVSMPMGTYHQRNPFRFSTKYWDEWFGLGYWGYRWYSPVMGRWISRDPIGEPGALRLAGAKLAPSDGVSGEEPNVYAYSLNAPSLRVDADGRLSGCCGPDVTAALNQLLEAEIVRFATMEPRRQMSACLQMGTISGWDINELQSSASSRGYEKFEQGGCGSGTCKGTVRYKGTCYRSGELNYLFYGNLNRLCRGSLHRWARRQVGAFLVRGIKERLGWETLDGTILPEDIYTCDSATSGVKDYWLKRRAAECVYGGALIDSAPCGAGSGECRAAWARAACDGTPVPQTCGAQGCGNECCNQSYSGPLSGHFYGARIKVP